MLIKSDVYDTYAICYGVTVNLWPFLLLHSSDFSVGLNMCAQRAFVYFWERFAIRKRLVPRPAISIRTMDTSPLVCLYSAVSCVVWRMSCTYCISMNLMKTWPGAHLFVSWWLCVLPRAKIVDPVMNFKSRNPGALMV